MKTSKYLAVILLSVLTLFITVSCSENQFLDSVLKAVSEVSETTDSLANNTLSNEDNLSNDLSYLDSDIVIITLSDSEETTPNELVRFNQLRLEIMSLHDQIKIERDNIKVSYNSIKSSIIELRNLNYTILEDDRLTIQNTIENLKTLKSNLEETRGLAYQRIYDLRGSYTRDNLPEINIVFEEVIEVLQYRLNTFKEGLIDLESINQILLDYLEV
jgi:hypothetical protein